MLHKISPIWLGVIVGTFISSLAGLLYIEVLHEPSSLFYPFAGLAFGVGPLIGGIIALLKTEKYQRKVWMTSSGITAGIVWILFIFTYLVFPLFNRVAVKLPEICNTSSGKLNPPSTLVYTLPGGESGVLLIGDTQSALVAVINYSYAPFPSTVFLVDRQNNKIIQSLRFANDIISAAMDEDALYIFNDKIGYFINARTGQLENRWFGIDNYGGLSTSENPILLSDSSSKVWYMETRAIISSWYVDGSVKSRRYLTFNGVALGCFIEGRSHEVVSLK